jgi:hypothetical protein
LLAEWDEKDMCDWPPLHHLGGVAGIITLPQMSDPNRATLWIYLVPEEIGRDRWRESAPIQRLVMPFAYLRRLGRGLEPAGEFPFVITTVTPGRYWIKAVLDTTEPLSKADDRVYTPQPGDCESVDSPVVTVIAGKTETAFVNCTHAVADGTGGSPEAVSRPCGKMKRGSGI